MLYEVNVSKFVTIVRIIIYNGPFKLNLDHLDIKKKLIQNPLDFLSFDLHINSKSQPMSIVFYACVVMVIEVQLNKFQKNSNYS